MRWNCPHCSVNLAIADEKMNPSWSFSRCYQCGGYALVRKSEVNIIKVDRAPAGEKVLLPESSESPMLSEAAARNLSQYTNTRSIVKPATRRNTSPGMQNPLHAAASHLPPLAAGNPLESQMTVLDAAPASSENNSRPVAGPNAPAGASVDRSAMPAYLNGVNNTGFFPDPLPEVPANANRVRFLPMAIGVAAAFALGSGLYLLMQSGEMIEKSRPTLSDRSPASMSSHEDAVARNNHDELNTANPASGAINTIPMAKVAQARAQTQESAYSDQVRSRAMAPERQPIPTAPHPVQLSSENPPLIVQPRAKNIHLRSGPGMVYPVVGNADERAKYVVTDWNDRWFKVLPQSPGNAQNGEEIAGWIRTDSVQVVPAPNVTATN